MNARLRLLSKATQWHVDVTHNNDTGAPNSNNSQVPGTPVVTITFGATENLWMKRYSKHCGSDGKGGLVPNSEILFRQTSGSFFVLDGEDEKTQEQDEQYWMHMSNLVRGSLEDVTFSYSMRAVHMSTLVQKDTCRLAHPVVGPKKQKQFLEGKPLFQTEHYHSQLRIIKRNVDKCMCDFKP